MKIGMAQLLVEGTEPERNFERAHKLIKQAAEKKCDLVLLPETIDFAWTHPNALKESQPIPGDYSDIFCAFAREYKMHICVGLTEKVEGKLNYNSAILINDNGEIILKHRKINLLEVEFPYYEIGQKLEVVDTPFGKIGLNICADNYIEATSIGHALARMGAQILIAPSSWTVDYHVTEEDEPYHDKWIKPLGTLAKLYDMVVVSTTSVGYIVGGPYEGKKMVGCSLAMDKTGILKKGLFNEFAGVLEEVEFEIPQRKEKGTKIGEMLKRKGYRFD
ncbi:MAG: carbon-nitrogen hydrolase family protein [Chitinophagales bacterium]|nr:carbon-nitrogen hydrolase family protein [Chitinophagales bacterium]